MQRLTLAATAAAIVMVSLSPSAMAAATITFDDLTTSGNQFFTSVSSGGANFSGEHFHILSQPTLCSYGGCVANGTYYLAVDGFSLGQPVTQTLVGGGTFSLSSFDGAELWLNGEQSADGGFPNARRIHVVGNLLGGGTITSDFNLDRVADGAGGLADFQSFTFGAGWTNLVSVTWSGDRNRSFSIDNIVMGQGNAVPAPSTLALLGCGFLAGFAARRRRDA